MEEAKKMKCRNMTRKPRIHVRILIYRTWAKNRKNSWKEPHRIKKGFPTITWNEVEKCCFDYYVFFYERILIIQVNTHGNKNCLVIETAYWCRLNCKLLVLIFNFLILWLYFRSVKWYNEREKSGQVVERLYSHLHRYRPHRQLAFYRLKELHFR